MSLSAKRILHQGEVELLFVKSKVYLHPTPSKKDNVPGFLTLSRTSNSTNLDIILSYSPENTLSKEEIDTYNKIDVEQVDLNLASLKYNKQGKAPLNRIVPKPSASILSSYSFTTTLSYIYSIQFRNPSHGYWYGSIIINTQDGEKLPIMFFHDDESSSTIKNQKLQNQQFNPFGMDDNGELYWGAIDFLKVLKSLINVQKSSLEPTVYLINPESDDLRNFAPFKKKPEQPKPNNDVFKLPDVNKIFTTAKWKVLETVATFSARTKNQVLDLIEDNAPAPIKEIIYQPEVTKIGDEFDSARIYLAKWAQQVKEEAELSSQKYMLDDDIYNKLNKELGSEEILTQEEINRTSRREEISIQEWQGFFDHSGRLCITVEEVKSRIFHGGLAPEVRKEAWLFLLNVYPWDSSTEEREILNKSYATRYEELKLKWVNDEDKRNTEFWKDQKFRIEKDVQRTDRGIEIFKNPVGGELLEEDDQFDVSNIRNEHLFKMREILLTFNEYNTNLGYVQGMTDLLSPLYVVFQDEVLTFWAFSNFMIRMERNFLRDQSGMKKQMNTLNKLLQFTLPNLYKHLESCQSNDLFFFFRMLLVWFKRELNWEQVNRLWEILWTDYYSSQFHLFFALGILSDNERIVVQNLKQFDEVLKYFNDLSGHLQLNPLLIRSEILFLKFKRMLNIIDRDNSLQKIGADPYETTNVSDEIGEDLRELLKRDLVIQKEVERPEGVGGG
ncbi:GYP7 [Candida pseudojiufengensis]|uniref:GYP7 n=1 Tax=Candida pseudojiufengensis TaxID=497109 RepID=UPI002225A4BE|nr:GYP7 [Candida pseudojiufengensis]KAI5959930.1 GYP7 [Candida pseudojiufengensis]